MHNIHITAWLEQPLSNQHRIERKGAARVLYTTWRITQTHAGWRALAAIYILCANYDELGVGPASPPALGEEREEEALVVTCNMQITITAVCVDALGMMKRTRRTGHMPV